MLKHWRMVYFVRIFNVFGLHKQFERFRRFYFQRIAAPGLRYDSNIIFAWNHTVGSIIPIGTSDWVKYSSVYALPQALDAHDQRLIVFFIILSQTLPIIFFLSKITKPTFIVRCICDQLWWFHGHHFCLNRISVGRNTFSEELAWETKGFPRYMRLLHATKPVLKVRFPLAIYSLQAIVLCFLTFPSITYTYIWLIPVEIIFARRIAVSHQADRKKR